MPFLIHSLDVPQSFFYIFVGFWTISGLPFKSVFSPFDRRFEQFRDRRYLFIAGKKYLESHPRADPGQVGFGFDDVYASGAIGFLHGHPYGLIGLILAMILAMSWAFLKAVLMKVSFFSMHIRLGIYFLIAALLILMLRP